MGDKEYLYQCGKYNQYQKNPANKAKFAEEEKKKKKLPGDFTPFMSKSFQI